MINTSNGLLKISDELTVFPGYSFEQFKHTKFYKNQDGIKIFKEVENLGTEFNVATSFIIISFNLWILKPVLS